MGYRIQFQCDLMGHYPKQDFYYGFLARYTGDSENKDQLYTFLDEIRDKESGENRERHINFQEAGDSTRHAQEKGVVGVIINDRYGPGEKVVENIPDKRDEYATDMSYLGGYHTGEFDLQSLHIHVTTTFHRIYIWLSEPAHGYD